MDRARVALTTLALVLFAASAVGSCGTSDEDDLTENTQGSPTAEPVSQCESRLLGLLLSAGESLADGSSQVLTEVEREYGGASEVHLFISARAGRYANMLYQSGRSETHEWAEVEVSEFCADPNRSAEVVGGSSQMLGDELTDCEAEFVDLAVRVGEELLEDRSELLDEVYQEFGASSSTAQWVLTNASAYSRDVTAKGRTAARQAVILEARAHCDRDLPERETTLPAPVPQQPQEFSTADEAMGEIREAWSEGDLERLQETANSTVAEVVDQFGPLPLGGAACRELDTPIGTGTPSDPEIWAICNTESEPGLQFFFVKEADGSYRAADAVRFDTYANMPMP